MTPEKHIEAYIWLYVWGVEGDLPPVLHVNYARGLGNMLPIVKESAVNVIAPANAMTGRALRDCDRVGNFRSRWLMQ